MGFLTSKLVDLWWKLSDHVTYKRIVDCPETFVVTAPAKTDYIFIDVYINAGTSIESTEYRGATHLLEHYLLEKIHATVSPALDMNGEVTPEQMILYCKIERKHFSELAPFFFSGIFSPQFDDHSIFLQEKQALINEITTSSNTVEKKIEKVVFENRYDNHGTNFQSSISTQSNIAQFELHDIEKWHQAIFTADNVKIFFSCNKPHRTIEDMAEKIVIETDLPKGAQLIARHCQYSGKKIVIQNDSSVTGVYVTISLPWVSLRDSYTHKMAANFLLDSLFNWNSNSLNQEVRNSGIYNITYDVYKYKTGGLLTITCHTQIEKVHSVLELISKHFKNAKTKTLPRTLVHELKRESVEQHTNGWRSNRRLDWITDELASATWNGGISEDVRSIQNVTPEIVMDIAKKYLDANKINLVIYGDITDYQSEGWLEFLNF